MCGTTALERELGGRSFQAWHSAFTAHRTPLRPSRHNSSVPRLRCSAISQTLSRRLPAEPPFFVDGLQYDSQRAWLTPRVSDLFRSSLRDTFSNYSNCQSTSLAQRPPRLRGRAQKHGVLCPRSYVLAGCTNIIEQSRPDGKRSPNYEPCWLLPPIICLTKGLPRRTLTDAGSAPSTPVGCNVAAPVTITRRTPWESLGTIVPEPGPGMWSSTGRVSLFILEILYS